MNLNTIIMAIYATYLTNKFGYLIKYAKTDEEKMHFRTEYSSVLLKKLNITVNVLNKEKLPKDDKYLLISNHRSIIDPLIIEAAFKNTNIRGNWVAKKELYNSFFFGLFTRNAGTIVLDREASNMAPFFKATKEVVKEGKSIFIFPEGTRNKENTPLGTFKEGARVIALKNRLNILPIYIKSNANEILKMAIQKRTKNLVIEVEIGKIIDYKDKTPLEENYRHSFGLVNKNK